MPALNPATAGITATATSDVATPAAPATASLAGLAQAMLDTDGCGLLVNDLCPATPYELLVHAVNGEGAGPWSGAAVAATLPDAPAAPPPPQLLTAPGSHALQLTWRVRAARAACAWKHAFVASYLECIAN